MLKVNYQSQISLREQVKSIILLEIKRARYSHGKQLPTERKLSSLLGVSKATVEHALRELVKEKIIYRKVGKGTFILKDTEQIPKIRKKTIALFISNLVNPIFAFFAQQLEELAFKAGYTTIFCVSNENIEKERKYVAMLKRKIVDGAIVLWPNKHVLRTIRWNLPWVAVGPKEEYGKDAIVIGVDLEKAGYLATNHLISLGHRRIGCIWGGEKITARKDLRLRGYLKALAEAKIALGEEYIVCEGKKMLAMKTGRYEEVGQLLMKRLLKIRPRPTAVIVYNDIRAIGAMRAIDELGLKIPDDIAIVGFDNIPAGTVLSPPLTTVDLRYQERAKIAFQILEQKIEEKGKAKPANMFLEPKLIIRNSCGLKVKR